MSDAEPQWPSALALFSRGGDWSQYDRVQRVIRQGVLSGRRWVTGEMALASPYLSNAALLLSARHHADAVLAGLPPSPPFEYAACSERIRLGFVGADFCEQATAYLTTGFIESIDRQRFEVVAYETCAAPAMTPYRQRVVQAYDRFVSLDGLSDEAAAARIHGDRIDVLLSLKSPGTARLGIFARRPARVQIQYLYYPGTSGMPFFDWLIADDVVVPPGAEPAYVEKILRLPGCYQPNDSKRPLPRETSRADWGLPEDAIVLANFGQSYKLTPDVFDLWCRVLRDHPRGLLWLLADDAGTVTRLRDEVLLRGVEPQRLLFAAPADTRTHLDRLRQADLVLDTFPYGGHTLSSDALWAGTPLVTRYGETFASRVAASLLKDVGLSQLAASSELEYLQKVDSLLWAPQQLRDLRQYLDQYRAHFALFDSSAYARKFEAAIASVL